MTKKHILTFIDGPLGSLEAIYQAPAKPGLPHVIVCHPHPLHDGSMHNKVVTTTANAAHIAGMGSLRFNYRGVGKSQGTYGHISGEVDDAIAVFHWLRSHQKNPTVFCAGFSFGAFIASTLFIESEAKDLVCIAPSINHMPYETLSHQVLSGLVIQGNQDNIVDPLASINWAKSKKLPCAQVEQSGHFFHGQLPVLRDILSSHWQKKLAELGLQTEK